MKWTVLWVGGAENDLAQCWVDASDRQAVTDAANEIDRLLAIDPLDIGESREEGRRILLVPPLGVTFDLRIACGKSLQAIEKQRPSVVFFAQSFQVIAMKSKN